MSLGARQLGGIHTDSTDEGYRLYWRSSFEEQDLIIPRQIRYSFEKGRSAYRT